MDKNVDTKGQELKIYSSHIDIHDFNLFFQFFFVK